MKRIVYSIFNDNVDQNHQSTNSFKASQFSKYKLQIRNAQQMYADRCGAEYYLHETLTTDYNSIQFEKLRLLEQFSNQYDQLVYLDFDVVPIPSAPNIFDVHDFNTIGMHPIHRTQLRSQLINSLKFGWFDAMNVYCKVCAKNAMLLLEDINGNDAVYNTGVIVAGKEVIKQLNFTNQVPAMNLLLDQAKDDSVFPEDISSTFSYNNEVYISYLVEKNKVPHTNLGMQWNFILDDNEKQLTAAGYFIHYVNKEFEKSFKN